MPQLGETVTEGTITKWYKAVGDQVRRDEPLFEVSTDKVDSEVPSPAEGVLTSILVEEGDTVEVGVTLAVIGDGASTNGSSAPALPTAQAAPAPPSPPPVPSVPTPLAAPAPPAPASAAPRTLADIAAADDELPASDHTGDPSPAPTTEVAPAAAVPSSDQGLVLSPVVRRLLNEHRIDPSTLTGTGLGGRITREDVDRAIAARGGAVAPPLAPAAVQAPPSPRATGSTPKATPSGTADGNLPPGTKWSRSPTFVVGQPSTWSDPRPPRLTP